MKIRVLYIIIGVLMLLTGCIGEGTERDEPMQERVAVNFDVYVGKERTTRAGTPGQLDIERLRRVGFGVFAYYQDNFTYQSDTHVQPTDDGTLQDFMFDEKITHNGARWFYEPLKYWPNETGERAQSDHVDRLSFFAYAPYVSEADADGTGSGIIKLMDAGKIYDEGEDWKKKDPHLTFRSTGDPTQGVDLLWGTKKWSQSSGDDEHPIPYLDLTKPLLPNGDGTWRGNVSDSVRFYFRHALSHLKITVRGLFDDQELQNVADQTVILVNHVSISHNTMGEAELNLNNISSIAGADTTVVYDVDATGKRLPRPLWYGGSNEEADPLTVSVATRDTDINWKVRGLGEGVFESCSQRAADDYFTLWDNTGRGVNYTAQNLFSSDDYGYMLIPRYRTHTDNTKTVELTEEQQKALTITVNYTVITRDTLLVDNTPKGYSVINNQFIRQFTMPEFQAGKEYTLQILLGMHTVKFEVEVEDWKTVMIENGTSASHSLAPRRRSIKQGR